MTGTMGREEISPAPRRVGCLGKGRVVYGMPASLEDSAERHWRTFSDIDTSEGPCPTEDSPAGRTKSGTSRARRSRPEPGAAGPSGHPRHICSMFDARELVEHAVDWSYSNFAGAKPHTTLQCSVLAAGPRGSPERVTEERTLCYFGYIPASMAPFYGSEEPF